MTGGPSKTVQDAVQGEQAASGPPSSRAYGEFLSNILVTEEQAIRFNSVLAVIVIAAGVLTPVLSHWLAGDKDPKWLSVTGGAVVSCLSSFPLKTIFAKKERLSALAAVWHIVKSIPHDRPLDESHEWALAQAKKFLEKQLAD